MNVPYLREKASVHAAAMIARHLGLSIDTAGRITDFNDGSNTKDLYEAVGLRFENLDNKAYSSLRRAIPTSLYEFFGPGDGITTTVGFPLLPALPASGLVRFVKTGDPGAMITIPAGFQVIVPATSSSPQKNYALASVLFLGIGQVIGDGLVRSLDTGTIGNTPANTIELSTPIQGIDSATNPAAFGNGSEIETDAARQKRFQQFIRNLARCQDAGLEYGAKTVQLTSGGVVVEMVLFARSYDPPDYRGLTRLFIDNGAGAASPSLVAATQSVIDGGFTLSGDRIPGYKASSIQVDVIAVSPEVVNTVLKVAPAPGYAVADLVAPVQQAIQSAVFATGVFAELVIARLEVAAMAVRGVADVQIVSPAANVPANTGSRILPGTVTVHEL